MHFVCKCTVCGTVFETPTELRQRVRGRIAFKGEAVNRQKGRTGAYRFLGTSGYALAQKSISDAARKEALAIPEETLKRGKKLENAV